MDYVKLSLAENGMLISFMLFLCLNTLLAIDSCESLCSLVSLIYFFIFLHFNLYALYNFLAISVCENTYSFLLWTFSVKAHEVM